MCLPPVFVVDAKGVGHASMTSPSAARTLAGVDLRIRLSFLVLVQIRPQLIQVEGDLVPDAVRPRGHELVVGSVVRIDIFAHGLKEHLTLRLQLPIQVVGELVTKQLVDGAALGAEFLHRLASPSIAETCAVGVDRKLQDGGSDTNC